MICVVNVQFPLFGTINDSIQCFNKLHNDVILSRYDFMMI